MDKYGSILTKEEWQIEWGADIYDPQPWEELKPIEVEEGKREELEKKLKYIYSPTYKIWWGNDLYKGYTLTKDPTRLLKIQPNAPASSSNSPSNNVP